MLTIYVDADGCPVKQEIYRVARRYAMRVVVAANASLRVPIDPNVEMVLCSREFNGADDWIAEQAGEGDVVVTADIPLAARCLEKHAVVLHPRGRPYTDKQIGSALAMRELMNGLRQDGSITGGPSAMSPRDRSNFLSKLDEVINAVRRAYPPAKDVQIAPREDSAS